MRLHWNTPIVIDGFLYGSSGRHTEPAELRAIELATGKVKWSQGGLGPLLAAVCRRPFRFAGRKRPAAIAAGESREIRRRGRLRAERQGGAGSAGNRSARTLQYPAWAAPILSHGLLYVRGKDRLACFEVIPDGK